MQASKRSLNLEIALYPGNNEIKWIKQDIIKKQGNVGDGPELSVNMDIRSVE